MIYLLHSSVRLGGAGSSGAQHYLGSCRDGELAKRIRQHQAGTGAKITRAFVQAGAVLTLVHTWPGRSWAEERRLKRTGHASRFCPLCSDRGPKGAQEGRWPKRAPAKK